MGEEPIPYDESCFEEKAIVVMNVRRSSSEEIVELTGIAIKNDMLYPVLTMTHGEDLNLDILNTALIAKIDKTALSQYTAGELLIINAAYPNRGSQHHTRFE